MELRHCDWGLANNFGNYIEINKNLKKYPELYAYVLKHELKHKRGFDLNQEFKFNWCIFKIMFFCIKYPKTLIDFLPIQFRRRKIIYDANTIFLYLILISIISFAVKTIF